MPDTATPGTPDTPVRRGRSSFSQPPVQTAWAG